MLVQGCCDGTRRLRNSIAPIGLSTERFSNRSSAIPTYSSDWTDHFCRRLIFLKDGVIEADGATDDVLTPEVLERIYQTRVIVQEIDGDYRKKQVIFLP